MNLRFIIASHACRQSIALVGAVFVHAILLFAGHFFILKNAEPSLQNRVLTLTLENTANQGLLDNQQADADTLNDAPVATPSDLQQDVRDGELTSAQELNHEGKPLVSDLPAPQESAVSELISERNSEQQASPLGAESAVELTSTALASVVPSAQQHSDQQSDLSLVTSEGTTQVTNLNASPPLEVRDVVALTASEQRMIDQRINDWAQTLNELPDTTQSLSWEQQGQTYVANVSHIPASGSMSLDEVAVEVTTEKDGQQVSAELRMKKLAFSNYGQFIHRWDPDISLHDDELTGRFHSNSRFNLQYSRQAKPVFTDKVTTASYHVDLTGPTSKKQIFLGGLETGVKRIDMPEPSLLLADTEVAHANEAITIERSSRLIFGVDGTLRIEPSKGSGEPRLIDLGAGPRYVIAAPRVSLTVQGTVNGTVAVYSPHRIIIDGDILYASTDSVEEGGDFLGLLSARNVVIAGRRTIGHGDLNVHAAIYAKGRFIVRQAHGPRAGTLSVFGSVSAGRVTVTEPRYATKIVFDERLENRRPPGFPVTERYELAVASNGWERALEPSSSDSLDLDQTNLPMGDE